MRSIRRKREASRCPWHAQKEPGFSHNADKYSGTYEWSYTWFVVAVLTPGGHNRIPRRNLQYNVHAKAEFTQNEICWAEESEDPSIREWLASIRGGDSIHVIPKAQWAAWVNYVQEIEIELIGNEHTTRLPNSSLSRDVTPGRPSCYGPLDQSSGEIRLIILDEGIASDPLSYCWGDPRVRNDKLCKVPGQDGGREYTLSITLALYTVL